MNQLSDSSYWDSIVEKVKPHIPTIDCDSSSSDNEETVTVYQRPAGLKVLDLLSMDDDGIEELLKPVAERCWTEESVKLDDDEIAEGSTVTQWGTQHCDADVEACERGGNVEVNRAKLDNSVKPNVDYTKPDEGFPVLSFTRLDQWDLDNVLQNLKETGLPLRQHMSAEPSKTHAGSDRDRSQEDIMERLVAYCNNQSSKSVSEPLISLNHIRQNNVCDKSSEGVQTELQLSQRACPTVYIDLRCPDPSIKPPRTSSNLSSESPAKLSTHQEAPPAKKANLKVHAGSRTGDREVTGKSMLLLKIREMNRNGNKYPSKYTDPSYMVPRNEAEELKETPVESTCSHESHHLCGNTQPSHVQFEYRNPKVESPPTTQQSTIREPKHQRDQQRQQVKQTLQHEQHQQILKQLEILRPSKSVNQKQPAAERTDVLYDFEASHLQDIRTLPAGIESKGCMLLTVDLSCPGMVGARPHRRRKHLNPASTKSHVYNTLVAWFLSLVGPKPRRDDDKVSAKVPFWVAGLQQQWTADGLALHVLAVAHHSYTPKKRDIDIHIPFYKHVCRFLSETSLTLIARWLPQLKNLLDQQAYALPIHLPSSCLSCFMSTTSNKKVIERTFGLSPGFYWQTVETQGFVYKGRETTQELHTEVSVALGCKAFLLHPLVTHYTLHFVLDSGLDVCGLRLLYPPQEFLCDSAGAVPVIQRTDETCQPVLALAVRGLHAHSALKDLTSSLNPLLRRETDLNSLQPLLLLSPQPATRVHRDLCLWFSGRLRQGSAQTHNCPLNRVVHLDGRVWGSLWNLNKSSSSLCATTKADLLLVVSPAVPPCCYGQVLAVCERRGFSLLGLQRLQLQRDGAAVLRLSNLQALVFCSPQTVTQERGQMELPFHCLVLLLRKENAVHHSVSLPAALMREFRAQKLLGCIHSRLDGVHIVEPSLYFHTVHYSRNLLHIFVRCMWAVPDPTRVILSHWKCSSNSNVEQVAILTLSGKDMSQGLSLLHRVLTEEPEGFKLLGLKWLPALTRLQAQELSPYEVGEQLCQDSLDKLMSSPALVCALRRVDALASLRKLLPHDYPTNLSVLMSPTPEMASRQASLFFFEHDMIPGEISRHVTPGKGSSSHFYPLQTTEYTQFRSYLPKTAEQKGENCTDSIYDVITNLMSNTQHEHPQMLLTVCLFKPTIWNHALVKIIHKVQLRGLTLVGLHVVALDESSAISLLPAESDASDLEAHVEYLCSGSSLALCLLGEDAVKRLLDVLDQKDLSLWTYCGMAHSYNGIYGSRSYQKAIQDVRRFFPEGLCCTETSTMRQEQILSMHSDPLASLKREQSCTLAPVDRETVSPSMASGPNRDLNYFSGIHSALWQTTCLLIPLNAPPLSQVLPQLEVLEQLLRLGCHLVDGRMSTLDKGQRKHIADTLKVLSGGDERMAYLYMVPCLIMALQGEAVVTGFNLILESIYKEGSDLEKVGKMIIYPENQKKAEQLICYLFDALSCQTIKP